jgi:uncharacterized protein
MLALNFMASLFFGLAFLTSSPKDIEEIETSALWIESVNGSHTFNVELAITPEEQSLGLMHRTSMAGDAGMLFVFAEPRRANFWMKNTLISLDLIFIDQLGRIHHISSDAVPRSLDRIGSQGPVVGVLEINGGLAAELGLAVGDQVHHARFDNMDQ